MNQARFATIGVVLTQLTIGLLTASPARAGSISLTVPILSAEPSMRGVIDESWAAAVQVHLGYDFTYRRSASELTTVYVGQDRSGLDIAFVAAQRESITSRQTTNGSNVLSDDYVGVYLTPHGTQGFAYAFFSNPQGARYQTSGENTAYTPEWIAVGRVNPNGFTVTMHIPFNVIRSDGSTSWHAQFVRATVATNGMDVWTYSPDETYAYDPVYAGTLSGVDPQAPVRRTAPRIQIYGLGELTTRPSGGDTSRVGLDASLPVTATSSFIATLHPDYSNVEIDQQTIAPTAFQRQYTEVRPFFTQTAAFFNYKVACANCPMTLYTPAIPTFSQGYAYEGNSGPTSFAAFDAIGDGRVDNAQVLNYNTQDPYTTVSFALQRVGVALPGLVDESTALSSAYFNVPTHLGVYTNVAQDRQDSLTPLTTGGYSESGIYYSTPTTYVSAEFQNVGSQFDPLDGYVMQNDIYGYDAEVSKTFNFAPSFLLHDIALFSFETRFHNGLGLVDQAYAINQINLDFKNLITLHLYSGDEGIGVPAYANDAHTFALLPFDGSGFYLGYKVNTTTPSYIYYNGGPYYHGNLDAWSYVTTVPLLRHLNLALELDSDRYLTPQVLEPSTSQILERVSLDWQITRNAEILFGIRRIIGANLPNAYQLPQWGDATPCIEDPYLPGCFIDASNVSLAYHFLAAHNEFYVVYGNPNDLSTMPALYVKWIRYIGAEKGT